MNKYITAFLILYLVTISCSKSNLPINKLPGNNIKLADIDLKKDIINFNRFSVRLPSEFICKKDTIQYPDFDIYLFKNIKNDSIIMRLYLGPYPDISELDQKKIDTIIGSIHIKIVGNIKNKNDYNILFNTGQTSMEYAHFWFNMEHKETALSIIRTIRRKY
jgi:hypothetical protein